MGDATMETEILERPLTYEEERGKPMPSLNHGAIQANLIVEFAKHREYRTLSEADIQLAGRFFTPDLVIYPRQSLDWMQDTIRMQEPPLVAVEIFSPTQGSQDVMRKVATYLQSGVKSCWVVSPPTRNVTIFTPADSQNFAAGVVTDPAIGITADLEAVFS